MVALGDEVEFERFFRAVEPSLRRAAYLLSGDREQAHDLVQETLVRAWEHWPKVSRHPHPDAWCRTVLRNLATSRWRRARLERGRADRRVAVAPGPSPDRVDVTDALRRLPRAQMRALVLHDVVGLTAQQVADEVGAPAGTVRAWLSRGREALAKQLADRPPLPVEGGVP